MSTATIFLPATLGAVARRVDHIGSTAVTGRAAKPIIDIQIRVLEAEQEAAYLEPLVAAGYRLRVREPGHRMFRAPELHVHIHVCDAGRDWERRHLGWETMNHYAEA